MTSLPIVERELRVAARRHGTYSLRLFMVLAAIALGVFFYAINSQMLPATLGPKIFRGLSALALIYGLASGRWLTADCLSVEKREGTLGLLFLTDLRGHDVVLGKLAATSLNAFFCLLAILPVMAVPMMMGGVSTGEFWRMSLVLVNTFLLALAIGLLASVLSWDSRRAMGLNFLMLLGLAGVPAVFAAGIAFVSPSNLVINPLLFTCPAYSFDLSSDAKFKWQSGYFWASIGVTHALTWLLVVLASTRLPGSWQDQPVESSKKRRRDFWQFRIYGTVSKRLALRKRLLAVNPFFWLAARAWFKPFGVWLAVMFVGLWWLFVLVVLHTNWSDEFFCLITGFILNCLLKLWIAVEIGHRLAEDQKIGALELLLTTPLTVCDILRGQMLALRRFFFGPLIFIIAVELFLVTVNAPRSLQTNANVLSFGLKGLVILLTDVTALIGVGILSALTARSPNIATVRTIFRVLILPSLLFLALSMITLFSGNNFELRYYILLWFWIGLGADIVFGLPAWWQVLTRFRHLAAREHRSARLSLSA
jgi:hypothetical protein